MSTSPRALPPSAEDVKKNSRGLRGNIAAELGAATPGFAKETGQLLKFHGIYPQQDRDARKHGETVAGCMVRVGIPGGVITSAQYLALDRLAEEAGEGTMRITSRQDIQFHRVQKPDMRRLLRTLNENLLTTLAACGDVVRNVVCCPAPSAANSEMLALARALSRRFKPQTRAYYEIWLDGEKASASDAGSEPLYGETYLPRKFKIGFAAPGDNCIDVLTQDVGVVPLAKPTRFAIFVGGGLGMSPGAKQTHPRLAEPLGTVRSEGLTELIETVLLLHRDFGNRSNRKFARLKYVVEEWGIERFRSAVEERLGGPLAPPQPVAWESGSDHLGWQEQPDGRWFLGLRVLSGRISGGVRTALREAAERFQPEMRFTTQQNVLLAGIAPEDRSGLERLLGSHGIALPASLPPILRGAMACPALPTCGLAITEAERAMPDILSLIGREWEAAGLGPEQVSIRVTGCSNGCARPYTAEIGLVGQTVNRYGIYLGGSELGTRLGVLFAQNVPLGELGAQLRPVFERYRAEKAERESFGDFCHRAGMEQLKAEVAAL